MAKDNSDLLRDAVVNNSKSIDRVLWTFLILEIAFVYLKLTKKGTFSWGGVEVNTTGVWTVSFFLLLTLAHLYTMLRFYQSARKCSEASSDDERERTFLRVTSSGGLFVRGLIPRTRIGNVYKMEWRDLTTIPSYLAAFGIIFAIVPFDFSNCTVFLKYLFIGLLIMVINWFIGSRWPLRFRN
jgi:hypothetical protein